MTDDDFPAPPLGVVFASLADLADLRFDGMELNGLRAHHGEVVFRTLRRNGCERVGDVLGLSADDLLGWRGVGETKRDMVVGLLADLDGGLDSWGSAPAPVQDPSTSAPRQRSAASYLADLELDAPALAEVRDRHDALVPRWLRANGCVVVSDLDGLSAVRVTSWEGIGPGKRDKILDFAADVQRHAVGVLAGLAGLGGIAPAPDPELEVLAAWGSFVRRAQTWGEVETTLQPGEQPPDVAAALHAVRSRRLPDREAVPGADEVLAGWIDGLDDRLRAILRGRLVNSPPRTLDDIGQDFAVTRERIRQLQTRIVDDTTRRLLTPEWRQVRWEVFAVRHRFGAYAPLAPAESLDLASSQGFPHALVLWLAGYERLDAAVRRGGFELPAAADLPRLDGGMVVDETALHAALSAADVSSGLLAWAADQISGTHRVDGALVVWPPNIVDKSIAVLEVRGVPMSTVDLVGVIGGGFNPRGLGDRLRGDPRVVRVTRSTYGLRAWGGDEYTSVVELMCAAIEERGPVELTALAAELAQRFGVSAASVTMVAAAPIFATTGGELRMRGADEPFVPRDELRRVRGLYRASADLLTWNIVADHDLLRGSGRALPQEIANAMGLAPGGRTILRHPQRDIPLNWLESSHTGPNIGSLRALVEQAEAAQGDLVRVGFRISSHSLEVSVVAGGAADPDADDPANELARVTGAPLPACADLTSLASVLQTDPRQVVDDLAARGEAGLSTLATRLPQE